MASQKKKTPKAAPEAKKFPTVGDFLATYGHQLSPAATLAFGDGRHHMYYHELSPAARVLWDQVMKRPNHEGE